MWKRIKDFLTYKFEWPYSMVAMFNSIILAFYTFFRMMQKALIENSVIEVLEIDDSWKVLRIINDITFKFDLLFITVFLVIWCVLFYFSKKNKKVN